MKVEILESDERESFARIVNYLLANNCLYQYDNIRHFEKKERNADYSFVNEHWDCFEEYLRYGGWLLCKERSAVMGMIYLKNEMEICDCRYTLTKLETQLLLVLRNYYEEKLVELDTSLTIRISVHELLHLLVDVFSLVETKPAGYLITAALNTLQKLNVIQKYKQNEEEQIWVLPYITCVLSSAKVEELLALIHGEVEEEDDEISEDAADQLAVLRENDTEL